MIKGNGLKKGGSLHQKLNIFRFWPYSKKSFFISITILLVLVLYFIIHISKKQKLEEESLSYKIIYMESTAKMHSIYAPFTAIAEAEHLYNITSPIAGKVESIMVKKGQIIKANQTLAIIAPNDYAVILEGITDEVLKLKNQQKSLSPQDNQYKILDEKIIEAQKRYTTSLNYSKNSQVRSPAHCRVEDVFIHPAERISSSDRLFSLAEVGKTILQFFVSSTMLDKIKHQSISKIKFDNGHETTGVISFVGNVADKDSLLFPIEVTVDDSKIPTGSGATISVFLGEKMCHSIPQSSLVTEDQGNVGVILYNEETKKVKFAPINIADHNSQNVFVTDLPDKVNIVIKGQGYLKDGMEALGIKDNSEQNSSHNQVDLNNAE